MITVGAMLALGICKVRDHPRTKVSRAASFLEASRSHFARTLVKGATLTMAGDHQCHVSAPAAPAGTELRMAPTSGSMFGFAELIQVSSMDQIEKLERPPGCFELANVFLVINYFRTNQTRQLHQLNLIMKIQDACNLAAVLSVASAHTIMQSFNGNPMGDAIYMPSSNMYQSDVNANTLACNGSPASGFRSSSKKITVQAGSTVTGQWLHELGSTDSNPGADTDNKVIASSHKGPVLAYMKKVSDATQNPSAGPGNGWFKIAEAGLISSNQWAVDALISAGGVQSVKIPSCIANGDYLLRFEIIALHSAYSYPGAQFYMECAQITVTGGTGTATPSTVSIPGAYSGSDPGIKISIYNTQGTPYPASYTIPGPPVFTCPSGSGSNPPATSSPGGGSGGGGATAPKYGQCGGIGWTGPTTACNGHITG
ncbi:hypothetical protein V497_07441 [Pseudogymnoascus sp. VKM F-4516 (FW-969)]|nr:hypothetical protein V497_07441 [Pseudogymnoascus sp. VKM F-4516 (FW-969)]